MCLFVIGLLTGCVEPQVTKVRMELAAHLEGVRKGIFLVAFGAAWPAGRLTPRVQVVAFWGAVYSTDRQWAMTPLAAIFDTGALSPLPAAGRPAQPWQEGVGTTGVMTGGRAIVGTSLLFLGGMRRSAVPWAVEIGRP